MMQNRSWALLLCIVLLETVFASFPSSKTIFVREKAKDSSSLAIHVCERGVLMSAGCFRVCMKESSRLFEYKVAEYDPIANSNSPVQWHKPNRASQTQKRYCESLYGTYYNTILSDLMLFQPQSKSWYKRPFKSANGKYYKTEAEKKQVNDYLLGEAIRTEAKGRGKYKLPSFTGTNSQLIDYFYRGLLPGNQLYTDVNAPANCLYSHQRPPVQGLDERVEGIARGMTQFTKGAEIVANGMITGPLNMAVGLFKSGYNAMVFGLIDLPSECIRRVAESLDYLSVGADYIMIKRFFRGWSGGNFDVYHVDSDTRRRVGKKLYSVKTEFTADLHYKAATIKRYPDQLRMGWGPSGQTRLQNVHSSRYRVAEAETRYNLFGSTGRRWSVAIDWVNVNNAPINGVFQKTSGAFRAAKYELSWIERDNWNAPRLVTIVEDTSGSGYHAYYEVEGHQRFLFAKFNKNSASTIFPNRWAIKVLTKTPAVPEYLLFQLIGIIDRGAIMTGLGYI